MLLIQEHLYTFHISIIREEWQFRSCMSWYLQQQVCKSGLRYVCVISIAFIFLLIYIYMYWILLLHTIYMHLFYYCFINNQSAQRILKLYFVFCLRRRLCSYWCGCSTNRSFSISGNQFRLEVCCEQGILFWKQEPAFSFFVYTQGQASEIRFLVQHVY